MTMKPEYNFGHRKTYRVTVYGGCSNIELKRLQDVYDKPRNYDARWGLLSSTCDDKTPMIGWIGLTETAYKELKDELDAINIVTEICENHIYSVFQYETFLSDLPKRYPHRRLADVNPGAVQKLHLESAQFRNRWFSGAFSKMSEYSFELWAENEQIEEAYRLTILPSFSDSWMIRVWIEDSIPHIVYKIGNKEYDCEPELKHVSEETLKIESWRQVQEFTEQNFWTAERWFGRSVNDGVIYLFEGWRNGEYKLLDDHSPKDENALSSKAMRLFKSLVE